MTVEAETGVMQIQAKECWQPPQAGRDKEEILLWGCESLSHAPLCDPMDCSPPGTSVCGILRARILEWVAFPFSMELF